MRRYGDAIVVLRASVAQDPVTGNETRDWTTATRSQPVGADVQPAGEQELLDGRQVTITRLIVISNPADIAAVDRIEWRGRLYDVDGEVGEYSRHGQIDHLEFAVKRASQ